ncbi:hypothetical protein ACQX3P_11770, partial [Corynebacterium diphtheriae]
GGLLAGDDVGVSPGNDGVRRFVESEDTINESSERLRMPIWQLKEDATDSGSGSTWLLARVSTDTGHLHIAIRSPGLFDQAICPQ